VSAVEGKNEKARAGEHNDVGGGRLAVDSPKAVKRFLYVENNLHRTCPPTRTPCTVDTLRMGLVAPHLRMIARELT